jgi:hypothetical protein
MTTSQSASMDLLATCQALAHRAREFTLPALLDVLDEIGVPREAIHFASHASLAPATTPVVALRIESTKRTSAAHHHVGASDPGLPLTFSLEVVVASGFFAANSPLATYLRRIADAYPRGQGLRNLLRLLDDAMLRQRLREDLYVGPLWQRLAAPNDEIDLRDLTAIDAQWSLDWLFRQCYPELSLRVERSLVAHQRVGVALETGTSPLGSASLGGVAHHDETGYLVHLRGEEVYAPTGKWWSECAAERFECYVRPRLRGQGLRLTVLLTVSGRGTVLHLASGSALGYEPLGENHGAISTIVLFSGVVS